MGYDTVRPKRRHPKDRSAVAETSLEVTSASDTSEEEEREGQIPCTEPTEITEEQYEGNEHPEASGYGFGEHFYALSPKECTNCMELKQQLKACETKIRNLQSYTPPLKSPSNQTTTRIDKFINTDKKVNLNTGLPNKAALNSLCDFLQPKVKSMRYWKGKRISGVKIKRKFVRTPKKSGRERKLNVKEELVLVLMKPRVGLRNDFICDMFGISIGLCSQVLNTWVRLLAKELIPLIFWPDKMTVAKMIPPGIGSKYPHLRGTFIDCTEIYMERPRHMELQAITWSDHKKSNTAKYLIGIAPNGAISFLSKGWGGRASDKHIVHQSGFLDLIDPGDVVLADRGFTINAELLMQQARLEIPPPSSGWEHQESAAVKKTKKVANARIHVERAIGRLKWFHILQTRLPVSLVPLLDDIVVICAALCNLRPPLTE